MEPHTARTAHRSRGSHWPDAARPRHPARRPGHGRVSRAVSTSTEGATASASIAGADLIPDPGLEAHAHAELARLTVSRKMFVPGDNAALAALDGTPLVDSQSAAEDTPQARRLLHLIYRARVMNVAGGMTASRLIGLAESPTSVETGSGHPSCQHTVAVWLAAVAKLERRTGTRESRAKNGSSGPRRRRTGAHPAWLVRPSHERLRGVARSSPSRFAILRVHAL